ncbi:hypothetical protein U0070_000782 [Myodes glareolus]|uniref:Uncharacterized protein n=1 Tax=Myodes glareolus TaxID=447135 RepID=A0AAW0I5S3_MYOGA
MSRDCTGPKLKLLLSAPYLAPLPLPDAPMSSSPAPTPSFRDRDCTLEGTTSNLWHEVVTVATANLACGDSGTLPLMDSSLCCWPQPWGSEKSLLPHHSCLLPSLCVRC